MIDENFLQTGCIISTKDDYVLCAQGDRAWKPSPDLTFFFPDFFFSKPKHWFSQQYQELRMQELIKVLHTQDQPEAIHWLNPPKETFIQAFNELKTNFQSGVLTKAVPYLFTKADATMTRKRLRWCLLNLLKHAMKNPIHIYGFWDQEFGILGGTPEPLFNLKKNRLNTVACAGTTRNDGELTNFQNDPKEKKEHQIVVQGILESLSPFGKVNVGNMEVLKLSTLSHLVTPIELQLNKSVPFETIVKALHPTPALGAYPRKEGMKWLESYQTIMPRYHFGAPVGYNREQKQEGACYVAIRNIQWTSNEIFIGAGCGVVDKSDCDKEWNEILLKIQSVKEMFSI